MLEVCERISDKKKNADIIGVDLESVQGVYYVLDGAIHRNPPRPYIEDLDLLPIPDRSLLDNFKWYLYSNCSVIRSEDYFGFIS